MKGSHTGLVVRINDAWGAGDTVTWIMVSSEQILFVAVSRIENVPVVAKVWAGLAPPDFAVSPVETSPPSLYSPRFCPSSPTLLALLSEVVADLLPELPSPSLPHAQVVQVAGTN